LDAVLVDADMSRLGSQPTWSNGGNYNARTVIDDAYRIVPGKGK
jgi:hypothetical protein